ncbi:MAG: hypothetical protein EBT80_00090 [Chitinophagales bacterium]|nr:hypothetical protein [Chitinophagales bacterium]
MANFKIPFQIVNGSVASVADGSIGAKAQVVSFVVQTNRGELPLEPTFGISDPTFEPSNIFEARAVITQFWPEIIIEDLKLSAVGNSGRVDVSIKVSE